MKTILLGVLSGVMAGLTVAALLAGEPSLSRGQRILGLLLPVVMSAVVIAWEMSFLRRHAELRSTARAGVLGGFMTSTLLVVLFLHASHDPGYAGIFGALSALVISASICIFSYMRGNIDRRTLWLCGGIVVGSIPITVSTAPLLATIVAIVHGGTLVAASYARDRGGGLKPGGLR